MGLGFAFYQGQIFHTKVVSLYSDVSRKKALPKTSLGRCLPENRLEINIDSVRTV